MLNVEKLIILNVGGEAGAGIINGACNSLPGAVIAPATKDIHKHTSCIGNARDPHINLVPATSKLESSWYSCDWPADRVSGYGFHLD